ncbi:MAG: DUF3240 domain-containing protein [Sphingomonas sanxanigenens]|uniref:DUF3240 domain-containing protein n=1 Tax=Sphingomonas sanxanigenens TaxID=397260 RepID=A0A2W5A3F8_9SPHN|nr:MAG: DUF3240 domain-containing protein [Sphingomonas sanxanigenens]
MKQTIVLRLTCATADADPVVDALRAVSTAPIQVQDEVVRGLDFTDAGTAEHVTGALRRVAIELLADADDVPALVKAAELSRRRFPVRWMTLPVLEAGRLP